MPAKEIVIEENGDATDDSNAPIVVEFGRASKKEIKRLMDGEGNLFERVTHTIEELRESGTIGENAQPVIIVVKQKPKKKSVGWLFS